jgi:hypothetical protein
VHALILVLAGAPERALEMLAQRVPLSGVFQQPLVAARCVEAQLGIRRGAGELFVSLAGLLGSVEQLLEDHGALERGAIARHRILGCESLMGQVVGEPRGVDARAQHALQASRRFARLRGVGEDAAESFRGLFVAGKRFQQLRVAQLQRDGLRTRGLALVAPRQEPGLEFLEAARSFEQGVEALGDPLVRAFLALQTGHRLDRAGQIADLFLQLGDFVEAARAARLLELVRHSRLGDDEFGGAVELAQHRDEPIEGIHVRRIEVHRRLEGARGLLRHAPAREEHAETAPVLHLLAPLEQRIQRFERGGQLALVTGSLVETRQRVQRLGLLRCGHDPALHPGQRLLRGAPALIEPFDLANQYAQARAIRRDLGLALVGAQRARQVCLPG